MEPRRATLADAPAIAALTEAAYLPNEAIIGVISLPRMADYTQIVISHEVWLVEESGRLDAALVLDPQDGKFTIWSIAVAPEAAGKQLGRALMQFAETRAAELGHGTVHLYTHAKLTQRIGWYERLGYEITHHEQLADRLATHMRKTIQKPT